MVNLGSSNTPVEGASFGLPTGAELTEDADGNLAIADSSGSIVLVRDETTGEWQFENTDLTGINAINTSSANVGLLSTESANINEENLTLGKDAEVEFDDDLENVVVLGAGATNSDTGDFTDGAGNPEVGQSVVIGTNAEVTHPSSIAIGHNAKSEHADTSAGGGHRTSMAIGWESYSEDHSAHAIGAGAEAKGVRAIAIGRQAIADNDQTVAIGYQIGHSTSADGEFTFGEEAIRIGRYGIASGDASVAIGDRSIAEDSDDAIIIGREANSGTNNRGSVAIGAEAETGFRRAIALGEDAEAGTVSDGNAVAIGYNTNSQGSGVAIGQKSGAETRGVAIGLGAQVNAGHGTAINYEAKAHGDFAVAIGTQAEAGGGGIALGFGADAGTDEMVINLDQSPVFELDTNGNLSIAGEITENASL